MAALRAECRCATTGGPCSGRCLNQTEIMNDSIRNGGTGSGDPATAGSLTPKSGARSATTGAADAAQGDLEIALPSAPPWRNPFPEGDPRCCLLEYQYRLCGDPARFKIGL